MFPVRKTGDFANSRHVVVLVDIRAGDGETKTRKAWLSVCNVL